MKPLINFLLPDTRSSRLAPRLPLTGALIALLVALLVSSCGWHLRGANNTPQDIDSIYIGGKHRNGELARELGRALVSQGVAVKENSNEAKYGLIIINEQHNRRTATVSGSARISEQELTESVDYSVLNSDGSTALPLTTATVERIFEYNEDNVLATDDEARLLRREMQRDLIRQIMNRLQSLGKTTASNNDANTP